MIVTRNSLKKFRTFADVEDTDGGVDDNDDDCDVESELAFRLPPPDVMLPCGDGGLDIDAKGTLVCPRSTI